MTEIPSEQTRGDVPVRARFFTVNRDILPTRQPVILQECRRFNYCAMVAGAAKHLSPQFGDAVPEGGAPGPLEAADCAELDRLMADYDKACSAWALRQALAAVRDIWVSGN